MSCLGKWGDEATEDRWGLDESCKYEKESSYETKTVNSAQKPATDFQDLLAQQHQQTANSFLTLLQAVLRSLVEFLA